MARPTDYTATVFAVEGGGIVVHYQSGERDKFGLSIPVPEGFLPTPQWVREQIEDHASRAFHFWDKQERSLDVAARREEIAAAIGKIVHTGMREIPTPPAPPTPPSPQPTPTELQGVPNG